MPYPLVQRSRSAAALLAALLLAAGSTVASGEANRIEFLSIEQAIPTAAEQEKVTVVYFTADWCGWCRKMESTTFPDPAVRSLAEPFVFAKVDADAQAHIAAMFDVRGLPAVRLLNASGELLEEVNGYLPPTRFVELLREHRDSATRPGAARQRFASVLRVIADLEPSHSWPRRTSSAERAPSRRSSNWDRRLGPR
jgi:thioredoxin-related protein